MAAINQTNDWDTFSLPSMPVVPAVQKFFDGVSADLDALRNFAPQMAGVLQKERATLNAISGDVDSSPAKMSRESIAAKEKARDALTRLMQGYEAALGRVKEKAQAAQNAPINPDAAVSELQLSTALGMVREIFAAAGPGNVGEGEIAALMALGMPGMTQAIRLYIGIWIQTQYGNAGTTLRQAVAKTLHTLLDKAAKPTAAPLYAAARAVLQELADSEPRLKAAYQMTLSECESGIWIRSGAGRIPAWQKGELVQIFPGIAGA